MGMACGKSQKEGRKAGACIGFKRSVETVQVNYFGSLPV